MSQSSRSVLVVDDDPIARELVAAALRRRSPIDVRGAASGAEAVELMEAYNFDLIICDLNMPDYDGVELISRLALCEKKPPLAIVSGAVESVFRGARVLAEALGLQVVGSMRKPVNGDRLWDTVSGTIG